jgi:hypothetical protein
MENTKINLRLPDELRAMFNQFRDSNFHQSDNAAAVALIQRGLLVGGAASVAAVPQKAASPVRQDEMEALRADLDVVLRWKEKTAVDVQNLKNEFGSLQQEFAELSAEPPEPTKIDAATGVVLERGGRIVEPEPAKDMRPKPPEMAPEEKAERAAKIEEIQRLGRKEQAAKEEAAARKAKEGMRAAILADMAQLKQEDWEALWQIEEELGLEVRTVRPEEAGA